MGKNSTLHHCPVANNCRKKFKAPKGRPYCPTHQTYCPNCPKDYIFVKETDVCPGCDWKHADHKNAEKEDYVPDYRTVKRG